MNFKKLMSFLLVSALTLFSQTYVAESMESVSFNDGIATSAGVEINNDKYVYLGGQTVGIAFYTKGIFITDTIAVEDSESRFKNPSADAGIKKGDYIISANGIKLNDISNLDAILKSSGGEEIKLKINRDDKIFDTTIIPVKNKDGRYSLGLWMRDSAAGLGTVTYIDPESNLFGALGHAVCDNDTGKVLSVNSGRIVECNVIGVKKGNKGEAGELKGSFGINARQIGEIFKNTKFGLVGKSFSLNKDTLIKVGTKNLIKEGEAYIFSDFENGKVKKYSVRILNINNKGYPAEKNIILQITDKALIDKTGGIVQGLSGSPIVQNNMLIGAVTHVMINDPQKGYGVFIENMFSEMTE